MERVTFDPQSHRFTVDLPFKEGLRPGTNLSLAKARLRALEKTLDKLKIREKYRSELQTLLDLKFVEPVHNTHTPRGPVSYLPHKEVLKEHSLTTKLRIFFDASAKEKGSMSLNETLQTGPNLTEDLLAVLIRFRTQRVVLLADIEKSFPQIIIREEHRDALRFLWDMDGSGKPQTFRLTRNYFGFASSSFVLAACVRKLLQWHESKYPETVDGIRENYYVDDVATGASSDEKATKLYHEAKEIFAYGSFNLRKWTSNSATLRELFRKNGDGIEKFEVSNWYNVLGLQYSPCTDSMKLKISAIDTTPSLVTKRTVLSLIASVFDRIGIAAPLLLPAKLLMQKLWTLGLMWDDPVPEQIAVDFTKWLGELDKIRTINFPRRYWKKNDRVNAVLHVFCDASQYAYGFSAYVVSQPGSNDAESALILAKSKVAPLKNTTIPRLELMALTLAAEAASYIRDNCRFKFDKEYLWTDNTGVYYQASSAGPETLPTFARNRVQKIKRLAGSAEILHVPGHLNTADLVSRGCTFKEFTDSNWLVGPSFIRQTRSAWPPQPQKTTREMKINTVTIEHASYQSFIVMRPPQPMQIHANFTSSTAPPPDLQPVFLPFNTCSKWSVYIRSIVRVRRAIDRMRRRLTHRDVSKPILFAALRAAEDLVVSQVQADAYGIEIQSLLASRPIPKTSSIHVLNPFLRDNLLRLGGRLGAHVGALPKNPIILPPKHPITKLILRDLHERSKHAGPSHVLIASRNRYWIPQGKRVIMNLIHSCANCRRFHLKPASAPTGPPPSARVSASQVFEHVGTDVIGPLYVRGESNTDKKVWIVIFTCCAVRAVHLELLNSLTTTEFLMSLRRFKARRGCPKTFYSDNAKAYKRAAEDLMILCNIMKSTTVLESLALDGIQWNFSIEKAPWYMGFTERLVGSVKTALKKVLGRAKVEWQELSTVLCEVEAMINSRPLCEVPESEHLDVLTPQHFLVTRTEDLTEDSLIPRRLKPDTLLKRWRHRKILVEAFWKRWEHEYLLLLRNFHETVPRNLNTLKVGQIVLIKDPNKPRLMWKMGRVERVNVSRDGIVRSCLLKVESGGPLQRPVSLLYPLEICDETNL